MNKEIAEKTHAMNQKLQQEITELKKIVKVPRLHFKEIEKNTLAEMKDQYSEILKIKETHKQNINSQQLSNLKMLNYVKNVVRLPSHDLEKNLTHRSTGSGENFANSDSAIPMSRFPHNYNAHKDQSTLAFSRRSGRSTSIATTKQELR